MLEPELDGAFEAGVAPFTLPDAERPLFVYGVDARGLPAGMTTNTFYVERHKTPGWRKIGGGMAGPAMGQISVSCRCLPFAGN